jgi:hypothetical protein
VPAARREYGRREWARGRFLTAGTFDFWVGTALVSSFAPRKNARRAPPARGAAAGSRSCVARAHTPARPVSQTNEAAHAALLSRSPPAQARFGPRAHLSLRPTATFTHVHVTCAFILRRHGCSSQEHVDDCLCSSGFYQRHFNGSAACVACPVGADCSSPGSILASLHLFPGMSSEAGGLPAGIRRGT